MSDDKESFIDRYRANFSPGDKFETPDGVAEILTVGRMNPSSGVQGFGIARESYWEFRVDLPNEGIEHLAEDEIKDRLNSGEWSMVD